MRYAQIIAMVLVLGGWSCGCRRAPETTMQGELEALDEIEPSAVDAAAALLEQQAGVAEGVDDPEGPFDFDSAIIEDIRLTNDVYRWTLRDRNGKQLRYEQSEAEMTDEDRRAVALFEMTRANPSLKRLVESAQRIAGAHREETP